MTQEGEDHDPNMFRAHGYLDNGCRVQIQTDLVSTEHIGNVYLWVT